jgi:hypothetical protein
VSGEVPGSGVSLRTPGVGDRGATPRPRPERSNRPRTDAPVADEFERTPGRDRNGRPAREINGGEHGESPVYPTRPAVRSDSDESEDPVPDRARGRVRGANRRRDRIEGAPAHVVTRIRNPVPGRQPRCRVTDLARPGRTGLRCEPATLRKRRRSTRGRMSARQEWAARREGGSGVEPARSGPAVHLRPAGTYLPPCQSHVLSAVLRRVAARIQRVI